MAGRNAQAAERQSFWNDFFNVFGVRRRTVATFEEPIKKLSGNWGSIRPVLAGSEAAKPGTEAKSGVVLPLPSGTKLATLPKTYD